MIVLLLVAAATAPINDMAKVERCNWAIHNSFATAPAICEPAEADAVTRLSGPPGGGEVLPPKCMAALRRGAMMGTVPTGDPRVRAGLIRGFDALYVGCKTAPVHATPDVKQVHLWDKPASKNGFEQAAPRKAGPDDIPLVQLWSDPALPEQKR